MRYTETVKRIKTCVENNDEDMMFAIVEAATGKGSYTGYVIWMKVRRGASNAAINMLLIQAARRTSH